MRESLKTPEVDPRSEEPGDEVSASAPAIRGGPGSGPSGRPGSRPHESLAAAASPERSRFERAIATWEGEGGSLIEAAS